MLRVINYQSNENKNKIRRAENLKIVVIPNSKKMWKTESHIYCRWQCKIMWLLWKSLVVFQMSNLVSVWSIVILMSRIHSVYWPPVVYFTAGQDLIAKPSSIHLKFLHILLFSMQHRKRMFLSIKSLACCKYSTKLPPTSDEYG